MKYQVGFLLAVSFAAFADNRSDQMNPNNDAYWESRGYDERPDDWESSYSSGYQYSQDDYDNRSNQLNSNNDAYWRSRGYEGVPDDDDDADEPDNTEYFISKSRSYNPVKSPVVEEPENSGNNRTETYIEIVKPAELKSSQSREPEISSADRHYLLSKIIFEPVSRAWHFVSIR